MKCQLVVNLLTATLIITPVLVGCTKGPQRPTPIPGLNAPEISGDRTSGMMGSGIGISDPGLRTEAITPEGTKLDPRGPKIGWKPDDIIFQPLTVYFDFDKSTVKPSERPKIEEVARRMKSEFLSQNKALRIEGHCDERGTEEYNRSLGERRALAIRDAIVQLGIDPYLIETISYGEDRPADPGHNEAAWGKNRRGVFILLTPPDTTANKE